MSNEKSRARIIFERYERSACWYGDRDLKPRQSEVRRAVTTLQKNLSEFDDLRSPKSAEAAHLVADFMQQAPDIILVSDAEVDCTLLRSLLKKACIRHPKFALAQNLVEVDQSTRLMEDLERMLDEHPGRHNALIDARALRDAMARIGSSA